MRDIKFRGKSFEGKWVYGDLTNDLKGSTEYWKQTTKRIHWHNGKARCNTPVIPASVGEYTGLKDIEGTDIFEGDILEDGEYTDTVEWSYSSWRITPCEDYLDSFAHKAIVIGNMYDNPEYMDGAE